jgi:hypothetical protein
MAQFVNGRDVSSRTTTRMTLQQIKAAARADGCTEAQFKYATEAAEGDPSQVAAFLIRRKFVSEKFEELFKIESADAAMKSV